MMITFGWFPGRPWILIERSLPLVLEVIICKNSLEETTHWRISTIINFIRKRRELRAQKDHWSVTMMWAMNEWLLRTPVCSCEKEIPWLFLDYFFRFAVSRNSLVCCFMWPLCHLKLLPELFLIHVTLGVHTSCSLCEFLACLLRMQVWKKSKNF